MTLIFIGFVTVLTLLQLALVVLGLYVQRRQSRFRPEGALPRDGISVILPIKGLDPGAAEHFRTWLTQAVTCPYEVIFSLQDPADPAIPVLKDLIAKYGRAPAQILVNPVLEGLNGKASNLLYGVAAARYQYLVMADADIAPGTDLLGRLVPPLLDEHVGQVAALPVVKGATNLWGGLMAMTWNMGLTSNWAPQAFLETAKTAPGGCFAIRRDVLNRIGGIPAFGGYVAEDFAMTRRIRAAGLRVVMGPTVTLEQGNSSWAALYGYYCRCGYVAKDMGSTGDRVFAYVGLCAPLLVLAGAALTGQPLLFTVSLGALAVRSLAHGVVQVLSDPAGRWRYALLYPLVEVALFITFVRAVWTDRVSWRGIWYRVNNGGLLIREEASQR
ncbi:MAG TPA: glycosyltransferase [Symbiobacteriaceae bacterium]|jgi:ceramide glucosyltransferase|nr:glycosyltransferase [Symbiobacteriaceae bacterium]